MSDLSSSIRGFIFFGVILLNFAPVKPAGYPLTIAVFLVFYFFRRFVGFSKYSRVLPYVLVLSGLLLLKGVFDIAAYGISFIEYFRTYFLMQFYLFFWFSCLCFNASAKAEDVLVSVRWAMFFTVLVAALQWLEYNVLGGMALSSFWGGWGYSEQSYVLDSIGFGHFRATSLYYEPSYFGLVIYTLLVSVLMIDTRMVVALKEFILIVLALFLASSFSAYLSVLVSLVSGWQSKKLLVVKMLVAVAVAVLVSILSSDMFLALEQGSSYYRMVAPLEILSNSLVDYPLGVPLGGMEKYILSIGVLNGGSFGSTLDNGWYLLIFYFGYVGVFAGFVFVIWLLYRIGVSESFKDGVFYSYFLMIPFFTGAVFAPEFLFLQMVVVISYRSRSQ